MIAAGTALAALMAAVLPAGPAAQEPDRPGAFVAEAGRLLAEDLFEDALDRANAAVDRWPSSPDAQVVRADALYRRGDFPEAEAGYRRAAELDPGHAAAHFGIGRIERTLGRYAEAAASFSRAAALAPDVPRHLRVLANHLARRQDAVAMLERYLELVRSAPDRGGEDEAAARNVEAWLALLRSLGDRPLSRAARQEPCSVPLQIRRGQPSLRLDVGGLRKQTFVFDTGATGVTVSPRIAAREKLQAIRPFTIHGTGAERTETGDLVLLPRLAVGEGIVLENVPATVRDPTGAEEGLIGPALFSAFNVRVDLKGRRLSFLPAGPAPRGRAEPFRNVGGQIMIRASINGVPFNAMVDTGASSTMIGRTAVARVPGLEALPGEWFPGTVAGIGGPVAGRKVIASGTLAFAGRSHSAGGLISADFSHFSKALESEVYILLGSSHLDDAPFTIDYGAMTVTFERP